MSETPRNHLEAEETPETFPTREEIESLFERFAEGRNYETEIYTVDEKGIIYHWGIVIEEEDGNIEYDYVKKGKHPSGYQASFTNIIVAFYNKDGIPVSGTTVAEYENGEWKLTPLSP